MNEAKKAEILGRINGGIDNPSKIDATKKAKSAKLVHKIMYTVIGSIIAFYLFRCTK